MKVLLFFAFQLLAAVYLCVAQGQSLAPGPACRAVWGVRAAVGEELLSQQRQSLQELSKLIRKKHKVESDAIAVLRKSDAYKEFESSLLSYLRSMGLSFTFESGVIVISNLGDSALNHATQSLQSIRSIKVQHDLARSIIRQARGSYVHSSRIMNISFQELIMLKPDMTYAHESMHAFLKSLGAYAKFKEFLFSIKKLKSENSYQKNYENFLSFEEVLTFVHDIRVFAGRIRRAESEGERQLLRDEVWDRKVVKLQSIVSRPSVLREVADQVYEKLSRYKSKKAHLKIHDDVNWVLKLNYRDGIKIKIEAQPDLHEGNAHSIEVTLENSQWRVQRVLVLQPEAHQALVKALYNFKSNPESQVQLRQELTQLVIELRQDIGILIESLGRLRIYIDSIEAAYRQSNWQNFDQSIYNIRSIFAE